MKNVKQGWYKLLNPLKFIKPIDNLMGSFNESEQSVQYKSSLELVAIKYCDFNKHITKFSLEPFAIKYIKPTDNKVHRYYIDLYIEFVTGDKFLVEIKPFSQTIPPKKPKKVTEKSKLNYDSAVQTYMINMAKWHEAKIFAKNNNMKFIFLTEKELKN